MDEEYNTITKTYYTCSNRQHPANCLCSWNRLQPLLSIARDDKPDLITKRIDEDRTSFGQTFDEAFSSQLQQRLNNTEMLFYRLLQKSVMYDRQRNPRAEVSDLSVSFALYFRGIFKI